MLDTIEVNKASKNIIHEENGYRYMGALHILYSQAPEDEGTFVEIRRWTTIDGTAAELVAEYGALDGEGELQTKSVVLPFHWGLYEALQWVHQRFLAENMKGVTVR